MYTAEKLITYGHEKGYILCNTKLRLLPLLPGPL